MRDFSFRRVALWQVDAPEEAVVPERLADKPGKRQQPEFVGGPSKVMEWRSVVLHAARWRTLRLAFVVANDDVACHAIISA